MMSRARNRIVRTCLVLLLTCSAGMLAVTAAPRGAQDPSSYSDWSTAVNLGPVLNSAFEDGDPFISKDGLSLYFSSRNRPGGQGGNDIWVAQRENVTDPWGAPQNLGPTINSPYDDGSASLSVDGHRLYFNSNRPDLGLGNQDIYVSRRHNKRDDFGWQAPVNLGWGVNSAASENQPCIFEDDGTGVISLYFTSNRWGTDDIYASVLQADETFGLAVAVPELSTAAEDRSVTIRRDGLELIFVSNRPGSILNAQGSPSLDLWVSTRASTSSPWLSPENLDPDGSRYINTARHDGGPALSFDGGVLFFHAALRPENQGPGCATYASTCLFDLWATTRTKLGTLH